MGITKPNLKYAFLTNCSSEKDPKGLEDALNNPVWLDAMHEELRALNQDNTWFLFHARQTWILLVVNGYAKQNSSRMA